MINDSAIVDIVSILCTTVIVVAFLYFVTKE